MEAIEAKKDEVVDNIERTVEKEESRLVPENVARWC